MAIIILCLFAVGNIISFCLGAQPVWVQNSLQVKPNRWDLVASVFLVCGAVATVVYLVWRAAMDIGALL